MVYKHQPKADEVWLINFSHPNMRGHRRTLRGLREVTIVHVGEEAVQLTTAASIWWIPRSSFDEAALQRVGQIKRWGIFSATKYNI